MEDGAQPPPLCVLTRCPPQWAGADTSSSTAAGEDGEAPPLHVASTPRLFWGLQNERRTVVLFTNPHVDVSVEGFLNDV